MELMSASDAEKPTESSTVPQPLNESLSHINQSMVHQQDQKLNETFMKSKLDQTLEQDSLNVSMETSGNGIQIGNETKQDAKKPNVGDSDQRVDLNPYAGIERGYVGPVEFTSKEQWMYVTPDNDGRYDHKVDFTTYKLREDFVATHLPPLMQPDAKCPWCKSQLRRVLEWPYYNWLVCDSDKCSCKGIRTELKLEYIPVLHFCPGCFANFIRADEAGYKSNYCTNSSYANDKWHPHQVLDPKRVVKDTRPRVEVVRKDIPANPDPPFPEDHDDQSNELPKDEPVPEISFKVSALNLITSGVAIIDGQENDPIFFSTQDRDIKSDLRELMREQEDDVDEKKGWLFPALPTRKERENEERKKPNGGDWRIDEIPRDKAIWEDYIEAKPRAAREATLTETNKIATMIFHANSKPI